VKTGKIPGIHRFPASSYYHVNHLNITRKGSAGFNKDVLEAGNFHPTHEESFCELYAVGGLTPDNGFVFVD
jgi:hypothetical protein